MVTIAHGEKLDGFLVLIMSWDGLYQSKTHHVTVIDGRHVATCGRRFIKARTTDPRKVSCFACLVKLGLIPSAR